MSADVEGKPLAALYLRFPSGVNAIRDQGTNAEDRRRAPLITNRTVDQGSRMRKRSFASQLF